MKPIIVVNHVWKEYQKGIDRRYKSLRDTISGIPGRFFGENKEKFWALQDVDFKVEAGESVGIIGRNGAGKSTLLKILARITPPTKGEIILRGRVASLLEVGTGFHPELTGRENVFFNGSILGMKNREIKRKFDEIIDFSGVADFIDTPLKHYSSGMQMRLAFSIAAHLESEILLIDEVLAVGDAEFQKKCVSKMDSVGKSEGKTILFVSHDMNKISQLTKNSIYIDNSQILKSGTSNDIIQCYLENNYSSKNLIFDKNKISNGQVSIIDCIMLDEFNNPKLTILTGDYTKLKIIINNNSAKIITDITIGIVFKNSIGNVLTAIRSDVNGQQYDLKVGQNNIVCQFYKFPLSPGRYSYNIVAKKGTYEYEWIQDAGIFTVLNGQYYDTVNIPAPNHQIALVDHKWQ